MFAPIQFDGAIPIGSGDVFDLIAGDAVLVVVVIAILEEVLDGGVGGGVGRVADAIEIQGDFMG